MWSPGRKGQLSNPRSPHLRSPPALQQHPLPRTTRLSLVHLANCPCSRKPPWSQATPTLRQKDLVRRDRMGSSSPRPASRSPCPWQKRILRSWGTVAWADVLQSPTL